jgi:hypothetical protein
MVRRRLFIIAGMVGIVVVVLLGCDQRQQTEAPQEPADQPASAPTTEPEPTRPTTRQLLDGEQIPLSLKVIPFTITVPKGWKPESLGGVLIIEGPTPAGVARIQITRHASPIPQHSDRLVEGAKKEIEANPGADNLAEVRKIGEIRALEYRLVGKTTTSPTIDSAGRKIADTATPMQWKLTAFVPNGKDFDLCELSFIDLKHEQYVIDRELLHKIVAGLAFDPASSGN